MESVHSTTRRTAASTSVFVKDEGPEGEHLLKSSSPSKVPSAKKPSPFWQTLRSWLYRKLKVTFLVLFIATNITLSIWIVFMHGNLPEVFPWDSAKGGSKSKKCHFPEIAAYSADIQPLIKEPPRIICDDAANPDFKRQIYFKTDTQGNLIKIGELGIPCCYRPFYRVNDGEVWIEPTRDHRYVCHNITARVTPIAPEHEYIEVICDSLRLSYRDGLFFTPRKREVDARVKSILEAKYGPPPPPPPAPLPPVPIAERTDRLSVIVIGFDSTSQLNFLRRMPKSLSFIKGYVKGIKLRGYNKVGENTLPNMVPLLSGMSLDELKELCVEPNPSSEFAVHIDHCPWIWKNFSTSGYVTNFAEDEVDTGIFNLHWPRAFLHAPTDHYFRSYSLRMWQTQNVFEGMCQGPRLSVQNLMEQLTKLTTTYDTRNKDLLFSLTWASKLTHDDFNRLGWADDHLLKVLKDMYESGTLNSSMLFLLGDHGSRNQQVRQTRQGQLEDRMPLAYVAVPEWFSKKYPTAYKNLKANANSLTSAYDIHATMLDVLDLSQTESLYTQYMRQATIKLHSKKKGSRYPISLFTSIPEDRKCESAGIPPHWCICHKKFPVSIKALDVADAAGFIVRGLNNILLPYNTKCETMRLSKIKSALKWHPEESVQDSYAGNAQEETYKRASLLQIAFETTPGPALYEVTVLYEPDNGWRFTEQVVRLDKYEEHSKCIQKEEIRKLCYCKVPTEDMDSLGGFGF